MISGKIEFLAELVAKYGDIKIIDLLKILGA